jgi:type I restriction enzyme R subunit
MVLSELDTHSKLIDPKIKEIEWNESHIVREYYFTDGRKLIGNERGKQYFVDYLLTYKNTNLAIIEAKAENKDPLDGLQQSINYAEKLRMGDGYFELQRKIYMMKRLHFSVIEDFFDYNSCNTPPPPLNNVPTRGFSS